jgi:hypothetical protein
VLIRRRGEHIVPRHPSLRQAFRRLHGRAWLRPLRRFLARKHSHPFRLRPSQIAAITGIITCRRYLISDAERMDRQLAPLLSASAWMAKGTQVRRPLTP